MTIRPAARTTDAPATDGATMRDVGADDASAVNAQASASSPRSALVPDSAPDGAPVSDPVEARADERDSAGRDAGVPDSGADECVGQRADKRIGRLIADRYRIVRSIGAGGMGEVYEIEQVRVKRRLAVKFLHPRYAERASMLTRFRREAEAAGRLEHENIASAIDYGDDEGVPYLVMEYLDGVDLARLVRAEGGMLPVLRAVEIVLQACRGIAAAHGAGIIHRDLKPQNLFVCRRADGSDLVKVLDFGVAKLLASENAGATHTGAALGTPCYMSPEQARGDKQLDQRTDVYSLGLILYECLTGVRPFAGDSYNAILHQVLTRAPEPMSSLRPGLPPRLIAIVDRAIAFEPADRCESAAALGDELRRLRDELRRSGAEHADGEAPLEPGMATEPLVTAAETTGRARSRSGPATGDGEMRRTGSSASSGERRRSDESSNHTATPWIDSAAPERGRYPRWLLGAAGLLVGAGLFWWWGGGRTPEQARPIAPASATQPAGSTPTGAPQADQPGPAAATSVPGRTLAAAAPSQSTADGAASTAPSVAASIGPNDRSGSAPHAAPSPPRAASPPSPKPKSGSSSFDRDNPYD